MRCGQARRNLLDRELGRLTRGAAAELELHLAACRACAARAVSEARLTAGLASLRVDPPFDVDVTARVEAGLSRLDPAPRTDVSSRQLGWAAAAASVAGLLLLAGFVEQSPELSRWARQGWALVSSLRHLADGVTVPLVAMASAGLKLLGSLGGLLGAAASFLSSMRSVGFGAVGLGAVSMMITITWIVGRDLRKPGWIRKES